MGLGQGAGRVRRLIVGVAFAGALLLAPGASASQLVDFTGPFEYETGGGPQAVALGDLNGDQRPELVTANTGPNTVSVRIGAIDGTFGARTNFATGSDPLSVAIGDLNADGKPDLAVGNSNSNAAGNTISVLRGNGDGTFAAKVDYATGGYTYSVAIGDFNSDGKPDLAAATYSHIAILTGKGDGTFNAFTQVDVPDLQHTFAVGDLNGDAKLDIAVSNAALAGSVWVLLGHGDGTFAATSYPTGAGPDSVAIGDLNGDGNRDLVTTNFFIFFEANSVEATASVFLGKGDGTFSPRTDYPSETLLRSAVIRDLNGDGDADLVSSRYTLPGAVSIMLGDGDGRLGKPVYFPAGDSTASVAVGHLDNNDEPDLATANAGAASASVLLNATPPDVEVSAVASPTADSTPDVVFTASDGGSGIASVRCKVDNGADAPCSSPFTPPHLSDGEHTVTVTATDGAGNTNSDSTTFTVDATAPVVDVTAVASPTADATPDVVFTASDSGSGIASVRCKVDNGAQAPCGSPFTPPHLDDGKHTVTVTATDRAGNTNSHSTTFTVDTTAPVVHVTAVASPTADSTPRVEFVAFDGESGIASVSCKVDNAADTPCSSPFTPPPLSDGKHTVTVTATDKAGNADSHSITFTVDATAPVVHVTAVTSPTADSTPDVEFTASDGGGSGIASVSCKVDNGAQAACSSPFTPAHLDDGNHTITVTATDKAGNTTSDSTTFTVDTTAPDTTITSGPTGLFKPGTTNDTTPSFEFTSDDPAATYECNVDASGWTPCSSPFTTQSLPDGQHSVSIRATDALSNVEQEPATATFTVAPRCTLATLGGKLFGMPLNACVFESRE